RSALDFAIPFLNSSLLRSASTSKPYRCSAGKGPPIQEGGSMKPTSPFRSPKNWHKQRKANKTYSPWKPPKSPFFPYWVFCEVFLINWFSERDPFFVPQCKL